MNNSVRLEAQDFHPRISKNGEMCLMGTFVQLDADYPSWLAESFKPAITKFFQDWTKVRIQALNFNGETVFDYRLWPEPPILEPIAVKVREANILEWKERA